MAYLFGGIALDTELAFEQLNHLNGRIPRLSIALHRERGSPPEEDVVHRSSGRYRLTCGTAGPDWVFRSRFPDVFVFRPACRRIDCHVASTDDRSWQDVLFRRVLPRIATTYGALAIHAAAVATGDRCLLLLGASGAGKSTLTTFCATAGWQVLSDDITIVWQDAQTTVEPVQRGMSVWDDVHDALSLDPRHCTPMPGYDGRKWWFQPPRTAAPEAHEPSALLVLQRSSRAAAPRLTRIAPEDALRTLMAQLIPFVPGAPADAATAAAFGRVAAIARRVPCFRLAYPDGYAALPTVERLLRGMAIGEANE